VGRLVSFIVTFRFYGFLNLISAFSIHVAVSRIPFCFEFRMLIDFFHSLSFKVEVHISGLFCIQLRVCLYPRFRVDIDVLVLLCVYKVTVTLSIITSDVAKQTNRT